MQILGIVMGTNLAPILPNICMAMLDEELYIISTHENITQPEMFKRFINDGFGIINSNKNIFQRGLMNLRMCKKIFLSINGILEIMLHSWTYLYSRERVFTSTENESSAFIFMDPYIYRYIPFKSDHPRQTKKNYLPGEFYRYHMLHI